MKLRTTPNAWQAVIAACTDPEIRSWLEAQAQVHPSVVNLDLDPTHALAPKAAAAIQSATFTGRTKGAVEKVVEALTQTGLDLLPPTPAAAPGPVVSEPTPEPSPVSVVKVEEIAPAVSVVKIEPVAVAQPTHDAEIDLVMNPERSIRDLMHELAVREGGK